MILFGCQTKQEKQKEAPLNVVPIATDDMGYGTTGIEKSTQERVLWIREKQGFFDH